jgi:hypothetical protein
LWAILHDLRRITRRSSVNLIETRVNRPGGDFPASLLVAHQAQ